VNNKEQKNHGMSVEEIIKSIRGIIDDHNNTNKLSTDDVLELTEVIDTKREETDTTILELNNDKLISENSARDTTNSFKQFAKTAKVAVQENKRSKVTTIEELVVEMMRPQLKKWLDENLPKLVQELVEKEIRRLIPDDKE
jgi:cell pole-organizing protein PopZ